MCLCTSVSLWSQHPRVGQEPEGSWILSPTPRCVASSLTLPHMGSGCRKIPGRLLTVGRWNLRESPWSGYPGRCGNQQGMQALGQRAVG